MGERICISDMTLDTLTAYIVGLGQPKFRAKQIFKWLHQKLVTEFSQMTDQPKTLLAALSEQCTIAAIHPPPPAVQGWHRQISVGACRRKLY